MSTRFAGAGKPVLIALFLLVSAALLLGQTTDNVTIKLAIVDKDLSLKAVPKFALVIARPDDPGFSEIKLSTSFEGVASVSLAPGSYVVRSDKPLDFGERTFAWNQAFTVDEEKNVNVELSNDNAQITEGHSDSAPAVSRRRVSEEGELFKTLRDGVVSVEGELGTGTGFIIDEKGLVLTNQHVISRSNEIRVRFDKHTSVRARLLAEDAERDIAVLQINLNSCPNCRVLKMAQPNSDEPPVIEGERVFAIGSPLYQEKILTSGIASKIEERAIMSDVNINPGNSGGPLFNSIGEVVGLTTFGIQADGGPGIAGIVRIEQAAELLAKARELAAEKGMPSPDLLPNMPEGTFPVETIKTQLDVKKFPRKPYVDDVKNYQVNYLTPVFKFYVSEKERLDSLKKRNKRNKDKGAINTVDRFKDLKNWNEYAGQLKPVVDILALPEVTASGKSVFLSVLTTAAAGIPTPLDYKFKADFYQMKLMCDGKEVVPLKRTKAEFGAQLPSYFKVKTRYTYAGIYTYPHDVFEPGKCGQMQLQIFSEENIEAPITAIIQEDTKLRIWSDFADYRSRAVKP